MVGLNHNAKPAFWLRHGSTQRRIDLFAQPDVVERPEFADDFSSYRFPAHSLTVFTLRYARLWIYTWAAQPGSYSVMVWEMDGNGDRQTAETAPPPPNGASGYHRVQVRVA